MNEPANNKTSSARQRAEAALRELGAVTIAVSGGVDSMTLAHLAHVTAGVDAAMVHAVSPAVPGEGTDRVRAAAAAHGWRLEVIDAGEFNDERYMANPVNRCYFCKNALYASMQVCQQSNFPGQLVSGTNLDDLDDFRPGLTAAAERSVVHPFVLARCSKADVRSIASELGLAEIASLPASPCLSSRVETGIRIDPDTLAAIHRAERSISAAYSPATVRCRVRHGGRVVLELDPNTLARFNASEREAAATLVARCFDTSPEQVELLAYTRGSAFVAPAGAVAPAASAEVTLKARATS